MSQKISKILETGAGVLWVQPKNVSPVVYSENPTQRKISFSSASQVLDPAGAFLQGQLTCDIRELNAHQHRFAAYCTHKGRVQATLRVFQSVDGDPNGYYLYLMIDEPQLRACYARLAPVAALSGVKVECIDNWAQCDTYGFEWGDSTDTLVQRDQIFLLRLCAHTQHWRVVGPQKSVADFWNIYAAGAQEVPSYYARLWDIQEGIPNITQITAGLFTPHMLGLDRLGAVSFEKGCYVGQEVVARTHYLGSVKRSAQYVRTEKATAPDSDTERQLIDQVETEGVLHQLLVK